MPEIAPSREITATARVVYALGDHTVNLALSALALVFLLFLTEIAGLRPALAGLVVWIARAFDAVSDPLMGRVSDATRWKLGRRRPYFLIGALPFGLFFMLLWRTPLEGQAAMFAYYTSIYIGLSLSMTVLSIPYMALIPEMATDYDARTSLNTYRSGAAVLGTMAAAGMLALTDWLGGGASGWQRAGAVIALWLVVPWPAVFLVSFERPPPGVLAPARGLATVKSLAAHASYRTLCGLYLCARIAVDVAGLAFAFYFTYWLGRRGDYEPTLILLFAMVLLSLPVWLRVAHYRDKQTIFMWGSAWWVAILLGLSAATPEWPRTAVFALAGLAGIGYAVADLMPWAMLGEVIDEDEANTGERREGLYNGVFTFLRKLGGATAFLLAGLLLDAAGFEPDGTQTETALWSIRGLVSVVPAAFLVAAILLARHYPLGRARHAEILARLGRAVVTR